jgi:large subunit ribosomal protein L29
MKKKDLQEKRKVDVKDLYKLVQEKKLKSLKIKGEMKVGKAKNLKESANLRREISQLMTIIKEKEIAAKEEKQ